MQTKTSWKEGPLSALNILFYVMIEAILFMLSLLQIEWIKTERATPLLKRAYHKAVLFHPF